MPQRGITLLERIIILIIIAPEERHHHRQKIYWLMWI
jgi:hypothetical protein